MSSTSHSNDSNPPKAHGNCQTGNGQTGNGQYVIIPQTQSARSRPMGQFNPSISPIVEADDEEELSLQQILTVLRRRAWVLGGVTLAAGIGIGSLVMTRPPSYAGSFRLLVEPVTAGSRLTDSLTSDTLQTLSPLAGGLNKDGLDYISQMEVLKSEKLLTPVLSQIQQKYPEIDYKEFQKRFKVMRPKDSKILDISYESADPEQIKFVLKALSEAFIDYSLTDRQTNLKRGINFVADQIQRQRQDVEGLEIKLEGFRRQHNLVDPVTSATALSDRIKSIASEQQSNRVQLAATRTLYENLRGQVGLSPDAALSVANLSEAPIYQDLLGKLREVDRQITVESARFTAETPIVQSLLDQRKALLPLLEAEANRVFGGQLDTSKFAQSQGFQGAVGRDLTKELVETANRAQVLQTQQLAFGEALELLNQQTQNLAGVSREYGQIQRDLAIATTSLGRLMTARENLQLEITRQVNPWEIISKINDDNIKPKNSRMLMLLLGALASLVIGVAAALIAEQFDRVYHTVEEIQEIGLPCLGVIPFNSGLSQEATPLLVGRLADQLQLQKMSNRNHRDHMMFMESFYSLDANLRLLSSDHPIRSITISSTSPADGKSTISAHLAWAAVTMGRKVLIIDTDMRRPQVHLWFGVQNLRGLSNAITAPDVNVHQLIQPSPQDPNLHVLSAGPMPPAPGRLLASKKMQMIIQELTAEYDLVICDAPPVQGFADAKLTAACTDGILLVLGLGKTDRNNFAQIRQDLENSSPAPILGLVPNGMKSGGANHYQYYYNRYYADRADTTKLKLPVSSGK
jgi:polysaccharide biosynthesis transport protein